MSSDTQPQPIPAMTVAGNRNAKNVPVGPDGRNWSNGLYNRTGFWGLWCLSCWCPCITYGRLKRRYQHLDSQGTPDPEHGGCFNSDCVIHGIIARCGVSFVLQSMLRGSIRQRYNIKGECFNDCCTAYFCSPCELTQESRELELEESSYGKS